MIAFMVKPLVGQVSLRFPRTPICANISARQRLADAGQGHNGTTNGQSTVVRYVVGKNPYKSDSYQPTTTAQREKRHPSCVCMHARAHEAECAFCRCAVVLFSQPLEKKEENRGKAHNTRHNTRQNGPETVVGTVVPCAFVPSNPLKNNKKGGFERGKG